MMPLIIVNSTPTHGRNWLVAKRLRIAARRSRLMNLKRDDCPLTKEVEIAFSGVHDSPATLRIKRNSASAIT